MGSASTACAIGAETLQDPPTGGFAVWQISPKSGTNSVDEGIPLVVSFANPPTPPSFLTSLTIITPLFPQSSPLALAHLLLPSFTTARNACYGRGWQSTTEGSVMIQHQEIVEALEEIEFERQADEWVERERHFMALSPDWLEVEPS